MESLILEKIVIVLATAVLVVPLFQRFRLSAVLGYLAAGYAIGPHGLGLIADSDELDQLAEFGVVFLLFSIGLELSFDRLRALRLMIFGLGAGQVLLCSAALAGIALLAGQPVETAVIIGLALALSSTAIVLQILNEQGEMTSLAGRQAFAVLLFQDIAVAPILALVPLLGQAERALGAALGTAFFNAVAALVIIALAGRYLLRPIFQFAARSHNREVFAALALLVALGTGWATHAVGLSMALGAFLAGLLLAGTEYRHQVEADIEPYRGTLLGFFFMTVGMIVDPLALLAEPLAILLLLALLLVVKAVLIMGLCLAFRASLGRSLRLALLLCQGGEFAFVIFGLAMRSGAIDPALAERLIGVVVLSMVLTPTLGAVGRWLYGRIEGHRKMGHGSVAEDIKALRDHVVIAGFGRSGRLIARMLAAQDIPHVAIDLDTTRITLARRSGTLAFYGNACQVDVLERAGLGQAKAVAVTIDQPKLAGRVISVLRVRHPDLPIIARAHDSEHGDELLAVGATVMVPETLEASLQLGHAVLRFAGAHEADAQLIMDRVRLEDGGLAEQVLSESGRG